MMANNYLEHTINIFLISGKEPDKTHPLYDSFNSWKNSNKEMLKVWLVKKHR